MEKSLLAHLYTRIKGSQEDVATMSLQYLISSYPQLNTAFNKLLSNALKIEIEPDVIYNCQSVGKNLERPDMSGVNKDGKEVVLCEMKFYAGLTANQPNGYLERLEKEGGKALVFVCPRDRRVSLWNKVKELCVGYGRNLEDEDGYRVMVDDIAMAMITWGEVTDELKNVATASVVEALPDISQLIGFCNLMDQEAFIPFTDEELGPETARREDRFYQVVDAVVDKLMTLNEFNPSIKGVRANSYWHGYSRAVNLQGAWYVVSYDRKAWKNTVSDFPFWLTIRDNEWKQPEKYNALFNAVNGREKTEVDGFKAIALYTPTNVPIDDIVDDMVDQILKYLRIIERL